MTEQTQVKEQLQKIFRLSNYDAQILALQEEREAIEAGRQELALSLSTRQAELEEKQGRMQGLEKERISLEGDVQLMQSRIKEFESKLNQIKTNKEYQAALKEVAQSRKDIKDKEDLILQKMSELEPLKQEVETAVKERQVQLEENKQRCAELDRKEVELESKIEELHGERAQMLPLIESSLLVRYERVKKMRSEGLASIEHGVCLGCHMRIPPQILNEILKGLVIHTCPSCTRVLYLSVPEAQTREVS